MLLWQVFEGLRPGMVPSNRLAWSRSLPLAGSDVSAEQDAHGQGTDQQADQGEFFHGESVRVV